MPVTFIYFYFILYIYIYYIILLYIYCWRWDAFHFLGVAGRLSCPHVQIDVEHYDIRARHPATLDKNERWKLIAADVTCLHFQTSCFRHPSTSRLLIWEDVLQSWVYNGIYIYTYIHAYIYIHTYNIYIYMYSILIQESMVLLSRINISGSISSLAPAEVPGKTKGQCVERFKFLREQLSKVLWRCQVLIVKLGVPKHVATDEAKRD